MFEVCKELVIGGHSAALQEAIWDSIAEHTVTGQFETPPSALQSRQQAKWVVYPAKVAPLLWVGIAVLLGWVFYMLFGLEVSEWVKTLIIIAYCAVIWLILTVA